jgi:hypothetical protein
MVRPGIGVLAALVLLAGCAPPGPTTPATTPATTTSVPPTATFEAGPTPTPVNPASAGQADTAFGPIWLTVPEGLMPPPLGVPAEPESGPASAAWLVPPGALPFPSEVAAFFVSRFTEAGLAASRDGPLEDGSYTVSASGNGCEIMVTAVPRGEDTFATLLYGAGCPLVWPLPGP